jgi:hypothetical protein
MLIRTAFSAAAAPMLSIVSGKANPIMDGQEMAALLKRIGWNGNELARRLGIRAQNVSRWLSDRHPIPDNVGAWLIVVADNADKAPALPEGWVRSE